MPTSPHAQSSTEIVAEVYAAFHRKDLEAIVERVAPDAEIYQTERLPWGGRYRGVEGILAFLGRLAERVESEVSMDALFEAGDRVVQVGRTRGRVRSSGEPFDVREVHVWRLREGRIVGFEAHIDTPAMETALGAGVTAPAPR